MEAISNTPSFFPGKTWIFVHISTPRPRAGHFLPNWHGSFSDPHNRSGIALGSIPPPHSPILQMEWPQLEIHETTEQLMASLPPGKNSMIWMHYLVPHFPARLPNGDLFPAPGIPAAGETFDGRAYTRTCIPRVPRAWGNFSLSHPPRPA